MFSRGDLVLPYHAIVDPHGFTFVADNRNNRVVIFDRNGKRIHCFGSKDSRFAQITIPHGVAYNNYNKSIYVCH